MSPPASLRRAAPPPAAADQAPAAALSPQVALFPSTRFMGSKEQLLRPIWAAIAPFAPRRVLDLFSGSGVVSYMLKAQGCAVTSNDQMHMANAIAAATVANPGERLGGEAIERLATLAPIADGMIWRLYGDIYFGRDDVAFLDAARAAVATMAAARQAIARAALVRACIKRRPRGIFTYTGHRYDDGRRDLKLTLREHFREAAARIDAAVFAGAPCAVLNTEVSAALPDVAVDLVYVDPPYFSPLSDNEYVRRYHFPEALARDWQGVEVQYATKTRKLRNYPNPFRSEPGVVKVLGEVMDRYAGVPVVISYGSNSRPDGAGLVALARRHGRRARVIEVDHRYSFANQAAARAPVKNAVKELIVVAV